MDILITAATTLILVSCLYERQLAFIKQQAKENKDNYLRLWEKTAGLFNSRFHSMPLDDGSPPEYQPSDTYKDDDFMAKLQAAVGDNVSR